MTARSSHRLVIVGAGHAGLAAADEAARAGLEPHIVDQRSGTAVWGIWGRDLAVVGPDDASSVITFEHLIIATGSFDRPVAFPGWTLAGVRYLSDDVPLGQRVVVAGFGSYVAEAVADLERRGVRLVAVLDGHVPLRAEGGDHLERVATETEDFEADSLILAYGYLPEDRLARLAGCALSGSPYVNPETVRDAWMRTTVPGVFVAGDAGGVVGPRAAVIQGRLAALGAAVDASLLRLEEALARAPSIHRDVAPPPLPDLLAQADTDTIICRCEGVTAGQIAERIFEDDVDPASVIAETRAGMGICQGRQCASLIAATLARHAHVPIERISPITPRPPIVPIPIGAIAERPPVFPQLTRM